MAEKKISIIQRIIANQVDLHSRQVKAWSKADDKFIVYWTPLTLEDRQKIQRHAQGDDQLSSLYTVIFKAQDDKGNLLFNVGDVAELLKFVDSAGIGEIALAILGIEDEQISPETWPTTPS